MKDKTFYILTAGFTTGIFLSSFWNLGYRLAFFLLILSILIFVSARFLVGKKIIVILLAIFIFSLALGIVRYEIKDTRKIDDDISQFVSTKVILEGIVADEPNVKENSTELVVEVSKINSEDITMSDKILVSTGHFPRFKYGDLVQVKGKLEKPENFTSETGNDFDYVGFLAKDDIFYKVSLASAWVMSSNHGSFFRLKLFQFKDAFTDRINSLIKEPESSLLGGLLLGAKNSLGKDLQLDFRKAGVSHIVALSGYNITIVAEGIMLALSFLPRAVAMSAGALGIFLFAIMTGGSATVMRASIMALLVLLAKATNRTYDVIRALLLAGLFMLIQNPKILIFDISFQLSFLSTLALIFVSPIIEQKYLKSVCFSRRVQHLPPVLVKIGEKIKFRELILATISTQIFVLPFIFYKMGMISLVSLPANILILPLIPTIMLFGFITGILAFISSLLAVPFAYISSLLLSYVLNVISLSAALPFSSLNLKNFPLILVILIYLIFLVIIWRNQIGVRRPTSLN
jgi:competence protein ComEC